MTSALAVVTARGGSKRIPRKNVKSFLGQPIIKYAIDAAKDSGIFDEVMISTDDQEIAEIGKSLGAAVPFMRSPANSNDTASTAPVILEVLGEYKKLGREFDYVCCIYPTAVFVTGDRLRLAKGIMEEKAADTVFTAARFGHPIQRAIRLRDDGSAAMISPEMEKVRSQDLEPSYHDCGQFYFLRVDRFIEQKKLFQERTFIMEVPESEIQDIDNEEDWKMAEAKFSYLLNERKL